MVAEALWLVRDCGFDGVQWDVEPLCGRRPRFSGAHAGDEGGALPETTCSPRPHRCGRPLRCNRRVGAMPIFAQVAATCDQMAVMCYDSGYLTPRAYVWLVRQQAIHVTHAARQGNPQCRVLLGVPTYGAGFFSHNPHAENLTMALRGVREGLADPGADLSVFAGIAPFADYTTSPQDWKTYATLWPNQDHLDRTSK